MCRYRPTDTTEWKTMKIPSKKITEATILNLTPGREYEFMVLSQDKHGDGMFSKSIRVLTQTKSGNVLIINTIQKLIIVVCKKMGFSPTTWL